MRRRSTRPGWKREQRITREVLLADARARADLLDERLLELAAT